MWEVQKQGPETVKQVLNSVKQVLNSVKQVLNTVKTEVKLRSNPVKRPCKPSHLYKPAWDPELPVCSTTPRFSYGMPKVTVSSSPHCSTGGPGRVYRGGYGDRVGSREGIPGG